MFDPIRGKLVTRRSAAEPVIKVEHTRNSTSELLNVGSRPQASHRAPFDYSLGNAVYTATSANKPDSVKKEEA